MDAPKPQSGRRKFFTLVGSTAAAGATVATLSKVAAPTPESADEGADPGGTGYRLTAHIRKYYRTTMV